MITTKFEGPIATLVLNRPETRNALSITDWQELRLAAEAIGASAARVVLLESEQADNFCSGSDIKAMADMPHNPDLVARFRLAMRSGIEALASLPMPTIANIQGNCFGAGVALALACDFRIAGDQARFGLTPAKLGIAYPYSDIARLVQLVGMGQARRLLLTAATIDRAEALRIGLVESGGGDEDVRHLAVGIAQNAPQSLVALKQVFQCLGDPDGQDSSDSLFDQLFAAPAFAEGMAAFSEKRPPNFADRLL
ncbi:MAG: hypothetical protein RLZZ136_238 [Pseudomonadota bacterium]|jgi:enoyl-CoA hydratase/carnithine racemase